MHKSTRSLSKIIISALLANLITSYCSHVDHARKSKSLFGQFERSINYIYYKDLSSIRTSVDSTGKQFGIRKFGFSIYGEEEDFFKFVDAMREARQKRNLAYNKEQVDSGNLDITHDSISILQSYSSVISLDPSDDTYFESYLDSVDYYEAQNSAYPCLNFYFGSNTQVKDTSGLSMWQKAILKMEKEDKNRTELNCKFARKYLSYMKQIEATNILTHGNTKTRVTPAFHSCEYSEGFTFQFYKTAQHVFDLFIKSDYETQLLCQIPTPADSSTTEWYFNSFKKLVPTEKLIFFIKIAELLDAMHSRKMVHNAFTPDSIVVDPQGNPLILDFLFVQPWGNLGSRQGTHLFADNPKLHSLVLDAPELFSPAADIYSFGMMVFLLERYNSKAYGLLMELYKEVLTIFDNVKREILSLKKKLRNCTEGQRILYDMEMSAKSTEGVQAIRVFNTYTKELLMNASWLEKAKLDKFGFPTGFMDDPLFAPLLAETIPCEKFVPMYESLKKKLENKKEATSMKSASTKEATVQLTSFFNFIAQMPRAEIENRFAAKLAPYLRRFHYGSCLKAKGKLLI
jgi:serine/threonine protein kinase